MGSEYAISYHLGYYRFFRQRTLELIQAQYSQDEAVAQTFIQKYGIDFWLLDRAALTPEYIASDRWLQQFQPAQEALARLQQGKTPALASFTKRCFVFEVES